MDGCITKKNFVKQNFEKILNYTGTKKNSEPTMVLQHQDQETANP